MGFIDVIKEKAKADKKNNCTSGDGRQENLRSSRGSAQRRYS